MALFASATLEKEPYLELIGEPSDGMIVVQKGEELQPNLILLDIDLPGLIKCNSGCSPNWTAFAQIKIPLVTEDRSPETVKKAF